MGRWSVLVGEESLFKRAAAAICSPRARDASTGGAEGSNGDGSLQLDYANRGRARRRRADQRGLALCLIGTHGRTI